MIQVKKSAFSLCIVVLASGCAWFGQTRPCSRSGYFSEDRLEVVCERLQSIEGRAQMLMVSPDITSAYMLACADPSLADQSEGWTALLYNGDTATKQALVDQLTKRCTSQPGLIDFISFVGRIPSKEQPKDIDCTAVSAAYGEIMRSCQGVKSIPAENVVE